MDVYSQLVLKIIHSQEAIIGPVAIEQAEHIAGLSMDWSQQVVTITGNPSSVIDKLIESYKGLFGQISVEVCREAAFTLLGQLPVDGVPHHLR